MDTTEQPITKKRGRPKGSGKISETVIDDICKGISNGLTYEGACSLAGISAVTFRAWRKMAEEAESGIFLTFFTRLEAAELTARNRIDNTLMKCATERLVTKKRQVLDKDGNIVTLEDSWMEIDAATLRFVAERRYSKDWGRRLDITSGDKPLKVSLFGAVGMGSHGVVDEE